MAYWNWDLFGGIGLFIGWTELLLLLVGLLAVFAGFIIIIYLLLSGRVVRSPGRVQAAADICWLCFLDDDDVVDE